MFYLISLPVFYKGLGGRLVLLVPNIYLLVIRACTLHSNTCTTMPIQHERLNPFMPMMEFPKLSIGLVHFHFKGCCVVFSILNKKK